MLTGEVRVLDSLPDVLVPRATVDAAAQGETPTPGTEAPSAEASGPVTDVAIGDWDVLLQGVEARLTAVAGAAPSDAAHSVHDTAHGGSQAAVLECVDDLRQLRSTLLHQLHHGELLERQILAAQAELSRLRAELAGTQAGAKQAWHQSRHDSLTALPNRYHFRERLAQVLTMVEPAQRELALLSLDLDGFKAVNDTHGHYTGDQLLRIVAARLTRALRAQDMVARLGGDEFACLLAGIPGPEQLLQVIGKLSAAVAAPVKIGRLQVQVRLSIGIVVHDGRRVSAEVLLKRADSAMYLAKRTGAGHAFFVQANAREAARERRA